MALSEIAKGIRAHLDRIAYQTEYEGDIVVEERFGVQVAQNIIKSDEDSVRGGTVWILYCLLAREARGDLIDEEEVIVLVNRITRDITEGDVEAAYDLIESRRKTIRRELLHTSEV